MRSKRWDPASDDLKGLLFAGAPELLGQLDGLVRRPRRWWRETLPITQRNNRLHGKAHCVRAGPGAMELRLPHAEALMRCENCENGERCPAIRARLAEREGRTALVLGVPVEICPACGQVWLTMDVAKRLDTLFNRLLSSGAESAQVHWEAPLAA